MEGLPVAAFSFSMIGIGALFLIPLNPYKQRV